MRISRRDFMRYAAASAAALSLTELQLNQADAVLAGPTSPAVLWLSGSGCTGCSVSLLNAVNPTIDSVLLNTISLKYHTTLMASAGDVAVAAARATANAGGYILVVEGAIPTASSGRYCYVWNENGQRVTMADAVRSLAANASYVVAVGTCASFGGIPAKYASSSAQGVGAFLGRSVLNLPGCPAHPDWIIGTLVQVLGGTVPALDSSGRPTVYYTTRTIHDRCPREDAGDASRFGMDGRCLEELGCKGPRTHADCDTRRWNNGQSYCIGVNGLCIGCTEPDYPAFPLHRGNIWVNPLPTPVPTAVPTAVPTPVAQQRQIQVRVGWNMISLPLVPANPAVADVLASLAGHYDVVYAYNAADAASPWKQYNVSAPPQINTLTQLNMAQGLWLRATSDATLNVSGVLPGATSIPLKAGWNLVGYPSQTTRPIAEALASVAGKVQMAYAYDAADPAKPWKRYDSAAPSFLNDLQQMAPCGGYWLQANQDCNWTPA